MAYILSFCVSEDILKLVEQYTTKTLAGKLILTATIIASGMAFLDGTVVGVALPKLQSALNANIGDVEWVINSFALALAALLLVSGAMGDRFGRKKIFALGIILFTLASALCGFSQSIGQLILFRAIQGIGSAMMIPGSLAIINASFAENTRGKAIGLWSGFSGGLAAFGPFVGGWLVENVSWQSIFFLNLPLGLLALFITLKYVPESKNPDSSKVDLVGTILITLGLLGMSYGLIEGPVHGWSNPIILSLVGGIVAFVAFLYSQTKIKQPLVPYHIFKSGLVTGANLVTLFLYFALYGTFFFVGLNLQQVQGYSPSIAGISFLPSILLITFLSGPAGGLADKIGPRMPMIVGPAIVGLGFACLAFFAGPQVNYFVAFLPGLVLFGAGMALVIAPLTKSALAVEHKYSGAASGVNNGISRIAALLSVAILGAFALALFAPHLASQVATSSMSQSDKTQLLSQTNKLGGIEMSSEIAKQMVKSSFIYSFKIIMSINAALAFLSAGISFVTIKNKG